MTDIQIQMIQATRQWIDQVVVGHNFCPYAKPVFEHNGIRYQVPEINGLEGCLLHLLQECQWLEQNPETETTLIIYSDQFLYFHDFLALIELADDWLDRYDFRGTYQLAHFHPDYCFADAADDDPSNYTNRSPYPTLHLLREASIETALREVKLAESVPSRNIRYANELGLEQLQLALQRCVNKSST